MLEKLTIEGFTDDALTASAGSCTLQINPETITHKYAVNVEKTRTIKTYKRVPRYVTRELETLSFSFYLDGTGVLPLQGSVADKLSEIRNIVYEYDGKVDSTLFLKVTWGGISFDCTLTSMDVVYELFNPSGSPLRAKVSMSFQEHITVETVWKKSKQESPDGTQEATVRPGESLPMMCHRVYGDSSHYENVAKANDLDSYTDIEPGQTLRFPPATKMGAKAPPASTAAGA